MLSALKKIIIGKPLATWELKHERLPVLFGLAILSSDAISSVAYATEEILWVLIPIIGIAAYGQLLGVSGAIIGLLALLVFSYRQTITAYPNGGGAYTVAKENLGVLSGLTAGAALSVGYILTVAVSTAAGTAAITSAFPSLITHRVSISLALILILTIINLRGVKESARAFSIPTYVFIICMLALIVTGLVKFYMYGAPPMGAVAEISPAIGTITIFLILRAFSSGCTALTGVEAVSNAVPNFKDPSPRNARIVLALLAMLVLIIFGGVSLLATYYHAVPRENGPTVISQITANVFGYGFMYYLIQLSTTLILIMASNTAYNGFPMLVSVIAQDGYAPRQLKLRGDRLSYSNGIIILSVIAAILIIIFRGDTHLLLPLYAVGVFLSFTLSQTGMTLRWIKGKEKGWRHKALINGVGALVTAIATLIIGATRFLQGAWIVVFLIPLIVKMMIEIKEHYNAVAAQLRINVDELKDEDMKPHFQHHVVVPLASINRAVVETLKYARSLSKKVVALHVSVDEEATKKWSERWEEWNPDIPLVIRYSPFREVIDPFVDYIDSLLQESGPDDKITILIPQFVTLSKAGNYFLHNQTSFFIREALILKHKNVVVANYPYYIETDEDEIEQDQKNNADKPTDNSCK